MKNILVPTDFSDCAQNALNSAVSYIRQFGGKLTLLHCLEMPPNWQNLSQKEKEKFPDALQRLRHAQNLLDKLRQDYSEASIFSVLAHGPLFREIQEAVEKLDIDLVIMGSYGSSGKSEYFIGSNTQKVVRSVHCPVLVIKDPVAEVHFKKIVFASNFNETEKEVFLKFKHFVKDFSPTIHLVAINTGSFFDAPISITLEAMETFKALAAPYPCQIHFYRDLTVDAGIRNFSRQLGADLIAISNYTRKPLKRMLVGSNVEALINHSHLPVLSVDFN